jgi:hypothetical protein
MGMGHRYRAQIRLIFEEDIQKILANLYWEGMITVKAAGYKRTHHGILSWNLIKLNKKLPISMESDLVVYNSPSQRDR